MPEFLKFILTGSRYTRFKKFNLICMILAIATVALAVALIFVSFSSSVTLSAVFGGLIVIAGIINCVISFKRTSLAYSLVSEQLASDGLTDDEVTSARRSLAEKFVTAYDKKFYLIMEILNILPAVIFDLTAIFAVLSALSDAGSTAYFTAVPILFAVGAVGGVVLAIISAAKDVKTRTDLYERADSEIRILKKYAGVDENKINKQSYIAQNTATRAQELFLCDPADRAELRKISTTMNWFAFSVFFAFCVLMESMGYMVENAENTLIVICASSIIGVAFAVWVCCMIWGEIRRRAIYKRNAAKLTDSEVDNMRRFLQTEFVKLQKRGNIFFSLFCGIPTLAGFILGLTGSINDPEASLVQNIAGCMSFFFLTSGLIAILIWVIVYNVYRKKVKPVEMQLNNIKVL